MGNLDNPQVIIETPSTAFQRVNIAILKVPNKNCTLTNREELTKFSQANAISKKSAKTIVSILLVYFQHFGTPLRIHCDCGRLKIYANSLMINSYIPEENNSFIKTHRLTHLRTHCE